MFHIVVGQNIFSGVKHASPRPSYRVIFFNHCQIRADEAG